MAEMDVASVIEKLGGTGEVARICSVGPSAVSNWKIRGIPAEHWLAVANAASDLGLDGITFESLARLRAEPAEARA